MICEIAEYKQNRERRVWYGSNTVNLCVDICNGEVQRGKLYHLYTGEPILFSSLLQALMRINDLYDELQFPQAQTELRSFLTGRRSGPRGNTGAPGAEKKEIFEMEGFEEMIKHRGSRATFLIRVQYRQHASWQGEVTWVDQQRTENFRSALELIKLLDSALNTGEKGEEK